MRRGRMRKGFRMASRRERGDAKVFEKCRRGRIGSVLLRKSIGIDGFSFSAPLRTLREALVS